MAEAEALLASQIDSDVPLLQQIGDHLREAGGKRIRPAMLLLSARAVSEDETQLLPSRVILAACAIEALHMASLMHDDVVDNSQERRGRRTANSIWGNEVSVLAGDFVLSRALSVFADHTPPRAIRSILHMTVSLCEGEMEQLANRGNVDNTVERYYQTIELKTANLFSTACQVGADLCDAPQRHVTAMATFGRHYGAAFQIADDLLDLLGDPSVTGKPRGTDLREGMFTLPVLLAASRLDGAARTKFHRALRRIMNDGHAAAVDAIAYVGDIAQSTNAVADSRRMAEEAIARAVSAVGAIPDSPAKQSLIGLAHDAIQRSF